MKDRKHITSLALSDEVFNTINEIGQGKSFTAKLVDIVERVRQNEQELVRYESEAQWENIIPRIINKNAHREFIDSAMGRGPNSNSIIGSLVPSKQKITKGLVLAELIPQIKAMGYIIQIIDDAEHAVFDVWVAKRETGCKRCKQMEEEFKKFVERIIAL